MKFLGLEIPPPPFFSKKHPLWRSGMFPRSKKQAKSGPLSLGKAATTMAEKVVVVKEGGGSGGGGNLRWQRLGGGGSRYGSHGGIGYGDKGRGGNRIYEGGRRGCRCGGGYGYGGRGRGWQKLAKGPFCAKTGPVGGPRSAIEVPQGARVHGMDVAHPVGPTSGTWAQIRPPGLPRAPKRAFLGQNGPFWKPQECRSGLVWGPST